MPKKIYSIWIENVEIILSKGFINIANVAPECYEKIEAPLTIIDQIEKEYGKVDIFSFGQRLPKTKPLFDYYNEGQSIAALKIENYETWNKKQISKDIRKNINKAASKGVVTKIVAPDDNFIYGVQKIYNESPVRQGKPFWHYNKDIATIQKENTYLDDSIFVGAYLEEELIGFIKMFCTSDCASTLQVISMIKHRDKKVNNALIAKAVEFCATNGITYLQYGVWSDGSLGQFKISNGFREIIIPYYFLPLTFCGKLALGLNLHKGIKEVLPSKIKQSLIDLRSRWYSKKQSS